VVASSLPELGRQHWRRPSGAGWSFRLALEVLSVLDRMRRHEPRGLSHLALAGHLRVQPAELEPVLRCLQELDWVGQLQDENQDPRLVLLMVPEQTLLAPLVERLLLRPSESSQALWTASRWNDLKVSEVLSQT